MVLRLLLWCCEGACLKAAGRRFFSGSGAGLTDLNAFKLVGEVVIERELQAICVPTYLPTYSLVLRAAQTVV